jgi:hypothetical protein
VKPCTISDDVVRRDGDPRRSAVGVQQRVPRYDWHRSRANIGASREISRPDLADDSLLRPRSYITETCTVTLCFRPVGIVTVSIPLKPSGDVYQISLAGSLVFPQRFSKTNLTLTVPRSATASPRLPPLCFSQLKRVRMRVDSPDFATASNCSSRAKEAEDIAKHRAKPNTRRIVALIIAYSAIILLIGDGGAVPTSKKPPTAKL